MNRTETIKSKIRDAFGDVPFPAHRGLRAALAMDDWVCEQEKLKRISEENDFKGKWWDVPLEELKNCSLASCYFDACGTEYYLPAYMCAVLDDPVPRKYMCLIQWLRPGENDDECNLYDYFLEKFEKIVGAKKTVCIEVLEFLREHVDDKCYGIKEIDEILGHEFWRK